MSNNLNLPQVTGLSSGKEATIDQTTSLIDAFLTEATTADVDSGNVNLTNGQWRECSIVNIVNADAAGRTVTIPAIKRSNFIRSDPGNAFSVDVIRGSVTITLAPGEVVWARTDGTTNGLIYIRLSSTIVEVIKWAISNETDAIATGTALITDRMPFAGTIIGVRASLSTQSSSGAPTFDINKNGTTVLSTKITIDSGEKTSVTAATPAVISVPDFDDDDEFTVDIDAAGTGAKGAKVTMFVVRAS